MFSTEISDYFYTQLQEIYEQSNLPPRKRFLLIRSIFKEILRKSTEEESQYFSSLFSRTVFFLDRYNVPTELKNEIKKLRFFLKELKSNKDIKCSDNDVIWGIKILTKTIEFLSESKPYETLVTMDEINSDFQVPREKEGAEFIHFIRGIVLKKGDTKVASLGKNPHAEIIIDVESMVEKKLILYYQWAEIYKLVWKGAVLNIFDVKKHPKAENTLLTTSSTMIVLEPDYLIDVTALAECFHSKGTNIYLYFLRKFTNSNTSFAIIVGNIVNYCFDELLNNPDVDFDTVFTRAIKVKPLQIFALAVREPDMLKRLRATVHKHFEALQKLAPELKCL